jgi:hypothetical protein
VVDASQSLSHIPDQLLFHPAVASLDQVDSLADAVV